MKLIFSLLLLIHGLIHFMGFAKAFGFGNLAQFSKEISKPMGVFWLLTALLFIISAILYLTKKETWPIFAIIAVLVSQFLIFMVWKDAKFGTIANVIILLASISTYGHNQFNKMVQTESTQILQNIEVENLPITSNETISQLPEVVQKWMQNSGVMGKEKIVSVRLKQKGEMKTKPGGKWMPFRAIQYFDVENPAFVWSTKVDFMPGINMVGRDKLIDGEGAMLVKLAGVVAVVDERNNEKITSGAMIRYMAEIVWFPSAALNDYIKWETIDANSVKATFTLNGKAVSGIYMFSDEGNFKSFEADRYYGGKNNSIIEKWKVVTLSHKLFNGNKIPNKCGVTWKLKEGDFNWLNLEITAWEYNTKEQYE